MKGIKGSIDQGKRKSVLNCDIIKTPEIDTWAEEAILLPDEEKAGPYW